MTKKREREAAVIVNLPPCESVLKLPGLEYISVSGRHLAPSKMVPKIDPYTMTLD